MLYLSSLSVSLDGVALPSFLIKYAGAYAAFGGAVSNQYRAAPGRGTDPAIQVTVGTQSDSRQAENRGAVDPPRNYLGTGRVPRT